MNQTKPKIFAVHGLGVEIHNAVPRLESAMAQALSEFECPALPDGFNRVVGTIRDYDGAQVLKHLSPRASRLEALDQTLELFQERERFWALGDRWGLAELNLLKGQWRSWVLPDAAHDPIATFERAVIWPMAQLLRPRGLHLLRAVAIARGGHGILILSAIDLERELVELIEAGYHVVGQRWTAMRPEDGRISLLRMPSPMRRPQGRPPDSTTTSDRAALFPAGWTDVTAGFCGATQPHVFCDTVVFIEPARRSRASVQCVESDDAIEMIRQAWRQLDPQRSRRDAMLPTQLAKLSGCARVRLSQRPQDLREALAALHHPKRTFLSGDGGAMARRLAKISAPSRVGRRPQAA